MKKILACSVIAMGFATASAHAGERLFDGGLGALSGGVAFGWPGAVAGGVVGYTKGPAISRALGLNEPRRRHRRRKKARR